MNKIDNYKIEWLSDPKVFSVNRIEAHSDHCYRSIDKNLEDYIYDLNGTWKFRYYNGLNSEVFDFFKTDIDDLSFDSINVPGHIQMQGYGKIQYVNQMYPWDGHEDIEPPNIPIDYNSLGAYVKYFDIPTNFKDNQIYISFQGVESAFYVWLNGKFVGYSEDSFTPSEFEISSYVKEKNNRLCVMVVQFSSGSWLEDQDFWRFSGIFRDVYLYTIPSVHVFDMDVRPLVNKDLCTGNLDVKLNINNPQNLAFTTKIELYDSEDNEFFRSYEKIGENIIEFSENVEDMKLWSAEEPNLYELRVIIYDSNGNVIEIAEQKIGFRRFEIEDKIMKLNGKRIVFNGVNRHEFNCKTGRAISKEDILNDIKLMKKNNINAVRTSHYPNNSYFYKVCDECGIYVIDETNLETHGTWMTLGQVKPNKKTIPNDNRIWKDAVLDRAKSMVKRDKNHASILMWSCGNESYGGKVIFEVSEWIRDFDNSRLVHYEGVFNDRRYNDTSDVESRMYAKPHEIEEYLINAPKKPFILCEYTHAMGNSLGGMSEYIELLDKYEMYQGGFIWDFIDQSILKKDSEGVERLFAGGDFGDRPTDAVFCCNGILYGDRMPSPKLQEVKYLYQCFSFEYNSGEVEITNRNLFTNTDMYECCMKTLKDGEVISEEFISVDIEPLSKKKINIDTGKFDDYGEYILEVIIRFKTDVLWAAKGHEVAFGQFVIKNEKREEELNLKAAELINADFNIGVKLGESKAMISKTIGQLYSLNKQGCEFIDSPIIPDFWRAPTDNDRGNFSTQRWAQWKLASLYAVCVNMEVKEKQVKLVYDLCTMPKTYCTITYDFLGNDMFNLHMEMDKNEHFKDLPSFGFSFKMPKEYNQVRWYGRGYHETYGDRKIGGRIGIYENKVIDNMARYIKPQECGNKTDLRWIEVTNSNGRGIKILSEKLFEGTVLPYTSHEIENAYRENELPNIHHTVVNISKKRSGVGGDDSWGAPVHDEYLLKTYEKLELDVLIKLL